MTAIITAVKRRLELKSNAATDNLRERDQRRSSPRNSFRRGLTRGLLYDAARASAYQGPSKAGQFAWR